jgi:tryptophan halogenase
MKIVIVGGGTAGWLAALYAVRFNHSSNQLNEIVVIESSKIPIIGAGEGSTGIMRNIINNYFKNYGINEIDFLYETGATIKLGINLKDWNGIGTQFYSPLQPTVSGLSSVDIDMLAAIKHGKYFEAVETGYILDKGYAPFTKTKKEGLRGYSYHFDAHKVGQYFKKFAVQQGVKVIDTEIEKLNINPITGELDNVLTSNGQTIESDMWFDCSGFSRVLIKPMGGGFKSYAEYLPVNGAIPYIHKYEKGEYPKLETLSWAMPNGWMWQIPTQERYGCGYVYSDMFTTYDKAVDELRKTTGRNIEPLRDLKFECGRVDNIWTKNVVAFGLAAGFVEPLEATSIHSTIIQLDYLYSQSLNFTLSKENTMYETNIKAYNRFCANLFDEVKDLIQMHYMTDREDSEFWKYCKYELKRTDKVKEILEISKYRLPSHMDFNYYHGAPSWGVWGWTVIGLGHVSDKVIDDTINGYRYTKQDILKRWQQLNHANKLNDIRCAKSEDFIKALLDKKLGR